MRAALTRDGIVDNVILVGENYTPPEGFELVELEDTSPIGPGFVLVDGSWSAPEVPPPPPVPPTTDELATRLDVQQRLIDALLLGGLDDGNGDLDDVLLGDLPDDGGSLGDLGDLGGLDDLPDNGDTLDSLGDKPSTTNGR